MIRYLMILQFAVLSSCSTTSGSSFRPSIVIERMPGHGDTSPTWTTGADPFSLERGQVYFTSTTTMSGDSRVEACMSAAADLGRVQILRQIKDQLTSSGQLSENSASSDPSLESLTAYLSQGSLSGVKVTSRYWERREESDASGQRVLRVYCAAKVSIAKSLLEKQLLVAAGGDGNPAIRQKLLEAQKAFLDSLTTTTEGH
jgi:hypothetical protein